MEQTKNFNTDYEMSTADSIRTKLKNYRILVSNLKSLSDLFQDLFKESYLKAQTIDDMPKGTSSSDPTSSYALSELIPRTQQRLLNEIKDVDNSILEIIDLINNPLLTNIQKVILETKYIDDVKWEYMSYKLSEKKIYYGITQIKSIHNKAIKHLALILFEKSDQK